MADFFLSNLLTFPKLILLMYCSLIHHLLLSGETGKNKMECKIHITEDSFGQDAAGCPVRRFTMVNKNNMTVQVINYGATVTCIKVPDKRGKVDDIILGFDDMSGKLVSSLIMLC